MKNANNQSVHPEPVEGSRSWFDKLTTNGPCHLPLFKLFMQIPLGKLIVCPLHAWNHGGEIE
jgi:hypothetical protein